MGRLIICTGKRAKNPYYLSGAGINVYSLDEIAFAILRYKTRITTALMSSALADFIENELELPQVAARMRGLLSSNAGFRNVVSHLLNSCGYADKEKIKQVLAYIDKFYNMKPLEREVLEADEAAEEKNYEEAINLYKRVINTEKTFSSNGFDNLDEDSRTKVYNNAGVCYAMMGSFARASKYFRKAYEVCGTDEALIQYFMALKLAGDDKEIDSQVKLLNPKESILKAVRDLIYRSNADAENSSLYIHALSLEKQYEDGDYAGYEKECNKLFESLKSNYKKANAPLN